MSYLATQADVDHHRQHFPEIEDWPREIRDRWAHRRHKGGWGQWISDPHPIYCLDGQWRLFDGKCIGRGSPRALGASGWAHSWKPIPVGFGECTPCSSGPSDRQGSWQCECACHEPAEIARHDTAPVLAMGFGSMLEGLDDD